MICTLTWKPGAVEALANLWLDSACRDEISKAANEIDGLLRERPLHHRLLKPHTPEGRLQLLACHGGMLLRDVVPHGTWLGSGGHGAVAGAIVRMPQVASRGSVMRMASGCTSGSSSMAGSPGWQ